MARAVYFPGLIPSPYEELEEFLAGSAHARARIRDASEVLGHDLVSRFREASARRPNELTPGQWLTHACVQMAICVALTDWLEERGEADVALCGGQSLGGWMAALFSGTLSWADTLRLTHESAAVEVEFYGSLPEPVGAHVYYHADAGRVAELAAKEPELELSLTFDAGVHAVAGPVRLLARLAPLIERDGGRLLYASNRIEHCAAARELRDRLEKEICGKYRWNDPRVPFVSEVDGSLITTGAGVRGDLLDTIVTPITWRRTVAALRGASVDTVHVVGTSNKNMFHRAFARDFVTVAVTPAEAARAQTRQANEVR